MESHETMRLLLTMERIAVAQEKLLLIAEEARAERLKLAEQMKERFRTAGFQGGPNSVI